MSHGKPRVILSGGNIAHYHHAALALQNAGILAQYLCVFSGINDLQPGARILPRNIQKRLAGKALEGLDPSIIHTITWPYLLSQALLRTKIIQAGRANSLFNRIYDQSSLAYLEDCEVFHFVSSTGLKGAQKVKKMGGTAVCDVREEHIDSYEEKVETEYRQLGLPYISSRIQSRARIEEEYSTSDYFVVPSEYAAGTFIEKGISEERIFVVPYGADRSKFKGLVDAGAAGSQKDGFQDPLCREHHPWKRDPIPGESVRSIAPAKQRAGSDRVTRSRLLSEARTNEYFWENQIPGPFASDGTLEILSKRFGICIPHAFRRVCFSDL